MSAKSLTQLKLNAKRSGWPWPLDKPHDERALIEGCRPDFRAAERVRTFFADMLCLPAADGGLRPFVLLDWWYRDVLGPLFGWKRPDGRRRFDKAFVTTAKKSAKSTICSGLPLYMMIADGEGEAECYASAVDRDQASIIYRKTSRMVKESAELAEILTRVDSQKRIVHENSGSFFEAISSDADSAEGKNPHLLIADELHVWRDRQFFNALMYGDIARRQPLFLMITTAGDEETGVGFEEYTFAKELLAGKFYSQSHFAFIAEAAPDREWDDPEGWKEANPSIDEGVGSLEKLHAKCDEAKQSPRKRRDFTRYICNRWTGLSEAPWLDPDAWAQCGSDPIPNHAGDLCCGALDLSRVIDLTAFCLAFDDGQCIDFLWWFWMPRERLKELEDRDRVPYRDWVVDGLIEATPGNMVDYLAIRRRISGVSLDASGRPMSEIAPGCLREQFDISAIGFDSWNSSKLVTELGEYDGLRMVEFGQGYRSMNAPAKALEARLIDRKIRHGNNPVVNWMASHCHVDSDPAGNIKPSKKKSREKIDGITAAVMALGMLLHPEYAVSSGRSIYSEPGNFAL